jgi:hypothetical protein
MKFSLTKVINFILILIFALALIVFLFWRLGIFKKEFEPSKEITETREKMQFLNNYPFQNLSQYFQKLSVTKIEIPPVLPEEIGKQTLF